MASPTSASLAERFRDRLPLGPETPIVTLGEGSTPLLPAPRLSARLDLDVWLKWEGANPTGSFKDRGMTIALSKAVEEGRQAVVCASTGNTAASAAAYAMGFEEADAGLPRLVAVESSRRAETAASAIRISSPAHASEVEQALALTGGTVVQVSDEALLEAWRALAQEEGIFCEPASAAPVAGLAQAQLAKGTRVVCVITGHGLKDPEAVERLTPPPLTVDPDPDAIAAVA